MVVPGGACLLPSPHQVKQTNGDTGTENSTLRRPRNREVTSRYRSSTSSSPSPASVSNPRFPTPTNANGKTSAASPAPLNVRRFPTPNVDRQAHLSDVTSPKRAFSAERRRSSPTRTAENFSSKGLNGTAAPTPPRRTSVRAELLWPSTRSLSSSVQLDSSLLPPTGQPRSLVGSRGTYGNGTADQTLRPSANVVQKPANTRRPTPERKGTPVRNQSNDQAENAMPHEVSQKPFQNGRLATSNGKLSGKALGRSKDISNGKEGQLSRAAAFLLSGKYANGTSTVSHSVGFSGTKSLSINEGPALSSTSQKLRSESRGRRQNSPSRPSSGSNSLPGKGLNKSSSCGFSAHARIAVDHVVNPERFTGQAVELADSDVSLIPDTASDTESVSSGGTTTTSSSGRGTSGAVSMNRIVRGTSVPARIWQDAASRSKFLSENKVRSSVAELELGAVTQARGASRYKTVDSPQVSNTLQSGSGSSSPWSLIASSRSLPSQRSLSPSKLSPYRNPPSPVRPRVVPSLTAGSPRSSSAAMMLNFSADARRGRKGLSHIEEVHLHRMLHNRLLQWQFVNARADEAMNEQSAGAEKLLYNVCVRISGLRSSVISKKKRLHQARQDQKLHALLSHQKSCLETWSILQDDHSNALKGAVLALEAAVLRVPVTGGVKADSLAVQDTVSAAYSVMNVIETSAAYLCPKADKSNSLVAELGKVAAKERILLEECARMLAAASSLEVEERSIRTHLVQCEHERARVLGHLMDTTSPPDTAVV